MHRRLAHPTADVPSVVRLVVPKGVQTSLEDLEEERRGQPALGAGRDEPRRLRELDQSRDRVAARLGVAQLRHRLRPRRLDEGLDGGREGGAQLGGGQGAKGKRMPAPQPRVRVLAQRDGVPRHQVQRRLPRLPAASSASAAGVLPAAASALPAASRPAAAARAAARAAAARAAAALREVGAGELPQRRHRGERDLLRRVLDAVVEGGEAAERRLRTARHPHRRAHLEHAAHSAAHRLAAPAAVQTRFLDGGHHARDRLAQLGRQRGAAARVASAAEGEKHLRRHVDSAGPLLEVEREGALAQRRQHHLHSPLGR
mmetsp:Transcript_37568/g.123984  ORF Transcript_37568/g.123984 Transcript_37568/m.123984 type:complete len:315 (+) Transcript_37568:717-1661(+)